MKRIRLGESFLYRREKGGGRALIPELDLVLFFKKEMAKLIEILFDDSRNKNKGFSVEELTAKLTNILPARSAKKVNTKLVAEAVDILSALSVLQGRPGTRIAGSKKIRMSQSLEDETGRIGGSYKIRGLGEILIIGGVALLGSTQAKAWCPDCNSSPGGSVVQVLNSVSGSGNITKACRVHGAFYSLDTAADGTCVT